MIIILFCWDFISDKEADSKGFFTKIFRMFLWMCSHSLGPSRHLVNVNISSFLWCISWQKTGGQIFTERIVKYLDTGYPCNCKKVRIPFRNQFESANKIYWHKNDGPLVIASIVRMELIRWTKFKLFIITPRQTLVFTFLWMNIFLFLMQEDILALASWWQSCLVSIKNWKN